MANLRNIYQQNYNKLGVKIAEFYISEFVEQGHNASGNLIRNTIPKVEWTLKFVEVQIQTLEYGLIVNDGVKPENIPFGGGRGGQAATSQFIQGLIDWIKLKGLAGGIEQDAVSFAFAIANKAKQTGIPTPGSFKFSKNNRRTGWIDYITQKYGVDFQDEAGQIETDFYRDTFAQNLSELASKYSFIKIL